MFFAHLAIMIALFAFGTFGANMVGDRNKWITATGVVMSLGALYGMGVMISLAPNSPLG